MMAQPKVVIVEDDPDLLDALLRQFRGDGFDVFSARNGREGVSRVLQVRPDLIVLDLLMPEMNGHEMMKELTLHHAWIREVPVIIITNYAAGEMQDAEWTRHVPVSYMVKSETPLGAILAQAKRLLLQIEKEVY